MKKFLTAFLVLTITAVAWAAPEIGKQAPAFSLKDSDGKQHSLADFKGKTVVLEWVNYGCPFVKKHYNSQNMQMLQNEATKNNVVWPFHLFIRARETRERISRYGQIQIQRI